MDRHAHCRLKRIYPVWPGSRRAPMLAPQDRCSSRLLWADGRLSENRGQARKPHNLARGGKDLDITLCYRKDV